MSNEYIQIRIPVKDDNYEIVCSALYLSNVKNILEENDFIIICIQKNDQSINILKQNLIKFANYPINKISETIIEDKNWNEEWEKTIEPVYIKSRVIIYPSWKKKHLVKPEGKILIEIDPRMSFGTGHNETTQIMLELMLEYITNNDKYLLDFGCGTGILSICGIKLGIGQAVAIDTDEIAVENAKEYFKVNKVSNRVKIHKSDISEIYETEFDIICANIVSSMLKEKFYFIIEKLKDNGKLFLSGILEAEKSEFISFLKNNNISAKDIRQKSEWVGIYAIKQ